MAAPAFRASDNGRARPLSLAPSRPRYGEWGIFGFFALCGAVSVGVTLAIVVSLVVPAIEFFEQVSITEFLTGTLWQPAFVNAAFGVLPIVVGSGMVVVMSLTFAVPIGLLSAIYLSEYAPQRIRSVLKPALEVLAGIPTVAIGLFALWFLRPVVEAMFPFLPWRGPFSIGVASIGVGLLIIPLVTSVADDAMRAVPQAIRDGAYALGATKREVATKVVFPAAISGIVASIVLAGSRAVGETMVVLIAAGAGNPRLSFDPTKGVQTMTAFIAGTATGDIATGTLIYNTIFAVGLLLFLITLIFNMIAIRFVRRYREVYD